MSLFSESPLRELRGAREPRSLPCSFPETRMYLEKHSLDHRPRDLICLVENPSWFAVVAAPIRRECGFTTPSTPAASATWARRLANHLDPAGEPSLNLKRGAFKSKESPP